MILLCKLLVDLTLYPFPVAAVTNYYQLSGLTQGTLILVLTVLKV